MNTLYQQAIRETTYQARRSIKTLEREVQSIKTATRTANNTVKTTQKAYQTAKASAKTAERTARATKQAVKVTEQTVKITAKAVITVVKATFTATKSLISMIIAGGWVAVFILLIVVLFGALLVISGSSESEYDVRYPRAPNEILEPEYSIYCGVLELKDCLIEAASAEVKFDVKATDINLSVNVPTTIPIVFNEDGTNTYPTNWTIENISTITGANCYGF